MLAVLDPFIRTCISSALRLLLSVLWFNDRQRQDSYTRQITLESRSTLRLGYQGFADDLGFKTVHVCELPPTDGESKDDFRGFRLRRRSRLKHQLCLAMQQNHQLHPSRLE